MMSVTTESKAIKNLLKSLKRRMSSERAIKSYLVCVEDFCKFLGKTPDQIVNEARDEKLDLAKSLQDFIDNLIDQKLAPKTVRRIYFQVQKFLRSNDIETKTRAIELPVTRIVYEDRAITKEEIRLLLKTGDLKQRTAVLLMASSGMRIGSVSYLKLKHLEKWEEPTTATPVALNIPSEAAKGHVGYTTFISPECCESLQDYLNYRRKFGEEVTPETLIIRDTFESKPNGARNAKPLTYDGVKSFFQRIISRTTLRHEKKKRYAFKTTHGFRKFFRTALDSAGVPVGAGEALMGHSAGLVSVYTRHTLEELRLEYSKAIPYLTIEKAVVESEIERRKQSIRDLAKLFPNMTEDKLGQIENLLANVVEERDLDGALEKLKNLTVKEESRNDDCQKVVNETDLEDWLSKGWNVVSVLQSGNVVISDK